MNTDQNTAPGHVLLTDIAYRGVRDLLMSGQLSPVRRLVESRLAVELDVSRTPLRQALVRLESDGLIRREEDGFYPTVPHLPEIRELYELRRIIERQGIDRIIAAGDSLHHDQSILRDLCDQWAALGADRPEPSPDIVLMDEEFHEQLLTASGSRVLVESLRSVNAKIRLVRMYDYITADRVEATITEHLAILRALLASDLETGKKLLEHNIDAGFQIVQQRAGNALGPMFLR
ncbi:MULTISPECIES: GntR family transcriptional regulator [Microbacterium]|uniref:DNA-binding transcriptional regulator, GntR family n=1 Tax=Microbacterium saccharophilum TaxID=1213358 RepID=A0A7Z7CX97_9MICO|nr:MULTISPECIES: GntR family transcriptional regulator [Microbacterium]SFI18044.1 DNA-binding transcriptional regulator, GntR family [Microbacterium saccharophilum]